MVFLKKLNSFERKIMKPDKQVKCMLLTKIITSGKKGNRRTYLYT
jgi:hypothetical protein